MQQAKLDNFFETRTRTGRPMVLATVFDTSGSTYSKPGARMLIDEQGIFQGMLSGGCLEGDLAIRAGQVIESGHPAIASYDLASGDDELWGLGVGCDGVMRIFLQPLTHGSAYEPFRTIAELQRGNEPAMVATIVTSTVAGVAGGSSAFTAAGFEKAFGLPDAVAAALAGRNRELLKTGTSPFERVAAGGGELEVFFSRLEPLPRVLVLGGGLDAEPVVRLAAELGWRCTVVDHRPAYVDNNDFAAAEHVLCSAAGDVHETLDLDRYDLAVVMSHHLDSDRHYLRQLAGSRIDYIGLLGPAGRRRRLLSELGDVAPGLQGRVHGPAGLDLGGRGPAAIALSIVAEMQQHLARGALRRQDRPAGSSG